MAVRNHAKLNVNAERVLGAMHCIRRMLPFRNDRRKRGMSLLFTVSPLACLLTASSCSSYVRMASVAIVPS